MNEIDDYIHRKPNPEYAKKLEDIKKHDKRIKFKDTDEFDKHFGS